jgi:hypothetical protein
MRRRVAADDPSSRNPHYPHPFIHASPFSLSFPVLEKRPSPCSREAAHSRRSADRLPGGAPLSSATRRDAVCLERGACGQAYDVVSAYAPMRRSLARVGLREVLELAKGSPPSLSGRFGRLTAGSRPAVRTPIAAIGSGPGPARARARHNTKRAGPRGQASGWNLPLPGSAAGFHFGDVNLHPLRS